MRTQYNGVQVQAGGKPKTGRYHSMRSSLFCCMLVLICSPASCSHVLLFLSVQVAVVLVRGGNWSYEKKKGVQGWFTVLVLSELL